MCALIQVSWFGPAAGLSQCLQWFNFLRAAFFLSLLVLRLFIHCKNKQLPFPLRVRACVCACVQLTKKARQGIWSWLSVFAPQQGETIGHVWHLFRFGRTSFKSGPSCPHALGGLRCATWLLGLALNACAFCYQSTNSGHCSLDFGELPLCFIG